MTGDGHPAYRLRSTTQGDDAFLRDAHHAGLRPWIEATWGWDERAQDDLVGPWIARRRASMQIVVVGDGDAGYLDVDEQAGLWNLNSVVLLPALQGGGIGTQVVEDLLARAAAAGVPVTLRVLKPNPARRLYERLGFTQVGETETHFQMRWAAPPA